MVVKDVGSLRRSGPVDELHLRTKELRKEGHPSAGNRSAIPVYQRPVHAAVVWVRLGGCTAGFADVDRDVLLDLEQDLERAFVDLVDQGQAPPTLERVQGVDRGLPEGALLHLAPIDDELLDLEHPVDTRDFEPDCAALQSESHEVSLNWGADGFQSPRRARSRSAARPR